MYTFKHLNFVIEFMCINLRNRYIFPLLYFKLTTNCCYTTFPNISIKFL